MDWKKLLFSFRGRMNRAKYWLVVLINGIISAVCIGIFAVQFNGLRTGIYGDASGGVIAVIGVITLILIAIFVSSLASRSSDCTTATRARCGCCCSGWRQAFSTPSVNRSALQPASSLHWWELRSGSGDSSRSHA